jgi:hypothetical protein
MPEPTMPPTTMAVSAKSVSFCVDPLLIRSPSSLLSHASERERSCLSSLLQPRGAVRAGALLM